MGEFSAHKINIGAGEKVLISSDLQLYVSPFGSDNDGSGLEEGDAFRTPHRAMEYLSDKIIGESGFVTINFAPGIYDLEQPLTIDHPQGERIALLGKEPDTLLLKYVEWYSSYGFTAEGLSGYYSGYNHGITIGCVRPDTATQFAAIIDGTQTEIEYRTAGYGVIIEDYNLVNDQNYNPIYLYSAYPSEHRNNLSRQGSILGAHELVGCADGTVQLKSTVRDEWFLVPLANTKTSEGEYFGNNVNSVLVFGLDPLSSSQSDQPEKSFGITNIHNRKFPLSTVPVGYYGTPQTTGIPIGATANFVGATFPTMGSGTTRSPYQKYNIENAGVLFHGGTFTGTGNAGSQINDSIRFGNNFHHYIGSISGTGGIGSSANWKSVNTNLVAVRIVPTVFRRNGNIMSVKSGGLRKIRNIFFEGVVRPYHYSLIGPGRFNDIGYSNKFAIYASSSKLGESVDNEPDGLETGLLTNVGIRNFHIGVYCDRNTNGNLGRPILSNCSYGVLSNKGSSIRLFGAVCTGTVMGFGASNASAMVAERCFTSFSGQSLIELRLKDKAGATMDFSDLSFIPGQTYASPDGRILGTVYDWDSSQKTLTIAVRSGALEGNRLTSST